MKLTDRILSAAEEGRPCYSFEYFPPKTPAGVENLYARIERMGRLFPTFVDVTWGAGGSTSDLTLEISSNIQNMIGLETMMHLTCTGMSRAQLANVLNQCRERGIENILALRGDPPMGSDEWTSVEDGFSHAVDLVRFIRQEHGDHFGICVAGYTDGHREAESQKRDVEFLAEKIDAGADLVITDMFYDADLYRSYRSACDDQGIDCPIIPGLMPIHSYRSFLKVTSMCRGLPRYIFDDLEPIKDDDVAVREYGVGLVTRLAGELLDSGAPGLHLYTLNLERSVSRILAELGLVPRRVERPLPWRSAVQVERTNEDVRPIFWSNRPRSYLARTMEWDEFPNGRWGDSGSPAFGDLSDYHMICVQTVPKNREAMWGEAPRELADIFDVFVRFCRGEVAGLPWYDRPLELESDAIKEELIRLNQNGLLTTNSQPRVNGAPSTDPAVGWGGPGGVVFQKAYLEFFVSAQHLPVVLDVFVRLESLSYHAINSAGESRSNCATVNAVTWGVFPGREVLQPTVVDPSSFEVWKDEAFSLWTSMWGAIYEEGSQSRDLLQFIKDTFFLVNVVDNDFVNGDLMKVFDEVLAEIEHQGGQQSYGR